MRTRANSIKSYLLIVSPYFPRFKLPNQTTFYKDEFPHLRYNPSEQEVQSTNCPIMVIIRVLTSNYDFHLASFTTSCLSSKLIMFRFISFRIIMKGTTFFDEEG